MVNKDSYTPQEVAEIANQYSTFSYAVAALEGLVYGRGLMTIRDVSRIDRNAMDARNALIKLDCATGVFKDRFNEIDRTYSGIAKSKVRAVEDEEED